MPFDIATGAELMYVEAEVRKRVGNMNGAALAADATFNLDSKSIGDLMAMSLTKSDTLIEGLIPTPGLTVLIGAKKAGKTVLAAQIALSITAGEALCGYYRIRRAGPVLFIEQDDPAGAASLKDIIERTPLPIADKPFRWLAGTDFVLGPDFLGALETEIRAHELRLVVIDSYTAIRGTRKSGGDVVKTEGEDFRGLDTLGKRLGCAILLLHHISHGNSNQHWSDRAAGTYAIGACSECQVYIDRFRELDINAPERLVRIEGRHVASAAHVLRFRADTLDYEHVYEGGAAEYWSDILDIRNHFGNRAFGPKDLCHETGAARITAHRLITRLTAAGVLQRRGYGEYGLVEGL